MNKLMQYLKKFWQSTYRWPVMVLIIIVFIFGLMMGGGGGHTGPKSPAEAPAAAAKAQTWTCSMHPQIRQPKPGKCPICFMDLIPVSSSDTGELGPRQLKLSPSAIQLADIRTAPVKRGFAATEIRMVGKVEFDETRLGNITARIPGRIDRVYVDYTGISVRKGDHLVSLYSPELITAQQELLQALEGYRKFGQGKTIVDAAREKLKLWGLPQQQIQQIENKATPTNQMTIYSPMAGIVIRKNAVEGTYVQTGTPLYTIADLTQVWVKMDAYESDLSWLRYGQAVEFETEAYPGEIFKGRIAFIDPVLDEKTRTVKVRVNVPNPQFRLKPEMFVRAVVRSKLSVSGKVMDPELAGKWISPMHPEIVKNGPGKCDICGMPLVRAEELGYSADKIEDKEAPLVIPASAPLITGKRAVVYTAVAGAEGTFEGKEITLGPRAGDYYIVKDGLQEGDLVVINGAFKIDSDLQIQAKPSMMSPEGGTPAPVHHHEGVESHETQAASETHETPGTTRSPGTPGTHEAHETPGSHETQSPGTSNKNLTAARSEVPGEFKKSSDGVAEAYFDIQHALSSDNLADAKKGGEVLLKKLAAVDMKLLSGDSHMKWMKLADTIKDSSQKLTQAGDIEAARLQLEILTAPMTDLLKTFGSGKTSVYRFHCPMAFDNKGAFWLQKNKETRNPYFGASMLLCKDSVEPLEK